MNIYGSTTTGHTVLKDFDLVAANSGGSIVAGALACDLALQDILNDFLTQEWRDKIFAPLPWYRRLNPVGLVGVPLPRYDAEAKLAGLQEVFKTPSNDFGGTLLSQLPALWGSSPQLVLTSFDYDRERSVIFRSDTKSLAASSAAPLQVTLAEAVHASSNAPIKYFNEPAMVSGRRFWDGAMAGLNNPCMVALNEALANGVSNADIRLRSIGTASVFLPMSGTPSSLVTQQDDSNITGDIKRATGCILADPPDDATFSAYAALGGKFARPFPVSSGVVVRLNPLVQPVGDSQGGWKVPGADSANPPLSDTEFQTLITMDIDPDQNGTELLARFADAWINDIVPNQPIRANSETLQCEIGHPWFSSAKATWPS